MNIYVVYVLQLQECPQFYPGLAELTITTITKFFLGRMLQALETQK